MNTAMMNQSPHRDVLEASPDTDESKARLVEELKNRGRAAVGAKSYMDAKMLYEKAVSVATDGPELAILNSNLSLVEKNMGNFEHARQAAKTATEADKSYVKGWWRLGQALQSLKRSEEALEALQKAKELEPSNKALIKEFEKVQKMVEEERKLMAEAAAIADAPQTDSTATATPPTTTTTTTTKTATTSKPKTSSSSSSEKMEVDNDDDKLFSKSEPVRGYKIVNGKKTSYFHNELDDKTKELIGDIAPKKLDAASTPTAQTPAPNGVSAWNKAGTWEEKDVTKWAMESLKEQIMLTTFTLPDSSPAPGAMVTVTKVKQLEGHASFALARGKKRYIYEFLCKLDWKLKGKGDDELNCSGSLALPDIDGTIDLGEGYEIHDFNIEMVSDNNIRPLIDRFVRRGGFHEALNENIDDWVRLFKKQF